MCTLFIPLYIIAFLIYLACAPRRMLHSRLHADFIEKEVLGTIRSFPDAVDSADMSVGLQENGKKPLAGRLQRKYAERGSAHHGLPVPHHEENASSGIIGNESKWHHWQRQDENKVVELQEFRRSSSLNSAMPGRREAPVKRQNSAPIFLSPQLQPRVSPVQKVRKSIRKHGRGDSVIDSCGPGHLRAASRDLKSSDSSTGIIEIGGVALDAVAIPERSPSADTNMAEEGRTMDAKIIPKELRSCPYTQWKEQHVAHWLNFVGLEKISNRFLREKITGNVLNDLDLEDLEEELGIMAPQMRQKVMSNIGKLRDASSHIWPKQYDHTYSLSSEMVNRGQNASRLNAQNGFTPGSPVMG